jgi:hypothetical protein
VAPEPVGTTGSETVVRTSAPLAATDPRNEPVLVPAVVARTALPPVTDCRVGPADDVQAPPVVAVPRPPLTSRSKVSPARTPARTVTRCVAVAVAPSSSVTVRPTV